MARFHAIAISVIGTGHRAGGKSRPAAGTAGRGANGQWHVAIGPVFC
jgi:hypothetical protein